MAIYSGDRVGDYVVEGLLGKGGMAAVWAVVHPGTGGRRALKVLSHDAPVRRDRLLREGRVQQRLDHPNILPVLEILEVGDSPALLMPMVTGPTLRELISNRPPTPDEAVALCHAVVAGLVAAHAAGVVHRDLKPANVLVQVVGDAVAPRVADFGLVKAEGDMLTTRAGTVFGTPAYAAPEQLRDAATVDARADLFSLGVMLTELLTGHRPFDGTTLPDLVLQHHAPPDLEGLSPALEPFVRSLVHPDLATRPASAGEVLAVLAAHLATPDPLGPLGSLATWVSRAPTREVFRVERPDAAQRWLRSQRSSRVPEATVALDSPVSPTPDGPVSVPHNIPAERDKFIGRAEDVAALKARLASGVRLVTVLGLGGAGKTRLVQHVARRVAAGFPGGVWWCDLSEAEGVEGVLYAVASALSVPLEGGDPLRQLGHALAARGRCLVVLDNAEHVVGAMRTGLERWLDLASSVTFVATSRTRLGLRGEQVLPVEGLEIEEALALFLVRARAANPELDLVGARDTLEELVRRLDGLPLAIELVAARARLMSPARMLAGLDERFRLLRSPGGRRDRHATMRAVLDGSWQLLAPWEQSALAQCAVFDGGFTLEAAEAVVDLSAFSEAWTEDAVQALLDRSLVRSVAEDRFDLYETVRAYVAERLGAPDGFPGSGPEAEAQARRRHGRFYARLGTDDQVEVHHRRGDAPAWHIARVELDNVRAACRRASARGDAEVVVPTCRAAWSVLERTGPFLAAWELAVAGLAVPGLGPGGTGRLARVAGRASAEMGRTAEALGHHEAALAAFQAAGDRVHEAEERVTIGNVYRILADVDRSGVEAEAALAIAREVGDRRVESSALVCRAIVHKQRGEADSARDLYGEALTIARELDDRRLLAVVTANLGTVTQEPAAQKRAFEEALEHAVEQDNLLLRAFVLANLSLLHDVQGEAEPAAACLDSALDIGRRLGARRTVATFLLNRANLQMEVGSLNAASALLLEALDIARELENVRSEANAMARLGEIQRRRGDPLGALRILDQAFEIADGLRDADFKIYAHGRRAVAYMNVGRLDESRADLEAALASARDLGLKVVNAVLLASLSELYRLEARYDLAEAALRECRALVEDVPHAPWAEAARLSQLGRLERWLGRLEEARAHAEAALALHRQIGDLRGSALTLIDLGDLHQEEGRSGDARRRFGSALELARAMGDRRLVGLLLSRIGLLDALEGHPDTAARTLSEGEGLLSLSGDNLALGLHFCRVARASWLRGDGAGSRAALAAARAAAEATAAAPGSELAVAIADVEGMLA